MNNFQAGPLLTQIQYPADMREKFTIEDLSQISEEVRQYIVDLPYHRSHLFWSEAQYPETIHSRRCSTYSLTRCRSKTREGYQWSQ